MNWMDILQQIFELCIIPLFGILVGCLVKIINKKSEQLIANSQNEIASKYINMLSDTITNCVIATNQTYVNVLKDQGAFTKEAQKEAFNITYKNIMSILSEDAITYLSLIYGDLSAYITTKIEKEVNENKEYMIGG